MIWGYWAEEVGGTSPSITLSNHPGSPYEGLVSE